MIIRLTNQSKLYKIQSAAAAATEKKLKFMIHLARWPFLFVPAPLLSRSFRSFARLLAVNECPALAATLRRLLQVRAHIIQQVTGTCAQVRTGAHTYTGTHTQVKVSRTGKMNE